MFPVNSHAYLYLPHNSVMSIGERARAARLEAGLKQKEVCQKVGIQQPTLSALENGSSKNTAFLGTLAATLGVNALWLQTGRGPKRGGSPELPIQQSYVPPPGGDELAEIITAYMSADTKVRELIRQSIKVALASAQSQSRRKATDDPQ